MNRWSGKPCALCQGRKGIKYRDYKYCGKCVFKAKKLKADISHAKNVQKKYGITGEDYLGLHAFQGGVCAICRRATGTTRRLSVDHDHKKGWNAVRGLLCRPCNNMLGHLRDDPEAFHRAALYLQITPYSQYIKSKGKSVP